MISATFPNGVTPDDIIEAFDGLGAVVTESPLTGRCTVHVSGCDPTVVARGSGLPAPVSLHRDDAD
jgi:hypothetical protein